MLSIIHRRIGAPSDVLETINVADPGAPGPGQVRIRVAYVAIHPGDLQIIEGSPASGGPQPISEVGRTPGFEGVGVIEALGPDMDRALGLKVGQRVAYFPVTNGWSERVVAPASTVTILADNVRLELATQALINTATAEIIIRTGHAAWPDDRREAVTVIQTGAASAVGRVVTALLAERNVQVIRLVRSVASARRLEQDPYEGPVIATEEPDWAAALRKAAAGKNLYVAVDGVGGPVLAGVAAVLSPGGTIVSYGALGGASADIRLVVPRALTIKGINAWQWTSLPAELRRADIQTAVRLAGTRPELFPVDAIYTPDQIKQAVEHVRRPGRTGAILLAFQGVAE
jgi:NADPH:quinone reductase-like Zn-dependent oxidoreductase